MSTNKKNISGIVFNIQKYSVHDGPGIRTLVFLKGCPLKCQWCSNPESQLIKPELAYKKEACLNFTQCVKCIEVCTTGAILKDDDNRAMIDRELCNECMLCVDVCPSKALTVYGTSMSVDKVLSEVETDGVFYSRSGGGLTLSGGEPMQQPEFTLALLEEAKRRRIKAAMETCGHCDLKHLIEACRYLNTLIYDVKIMDPERHKAGTGVSNELILENLKQVREALPDLSILVRTPIVPGFNDNPDDIRSILDHINGIKSISFEMLPYHRLGKPKYDYLDMDFQMDDKKLEDGVIKELQDLVRSDYGHMLMENS